MIEISGWLLSVTGGSRVAQIQVDGRGVARIPLSTAQERALVGSVGKAIKIVLRGEAEEKES
jgi:hypothetical protein